MGNLMEALLGWLTWMGLVFAGVGGLLFVLSAIRSLVLLVQRARAVGLESEPKVNEETREARI